MAKKQQPKIDEQPSIGSQMKSNVTARDRNLALKAKMVEDGTHPEPKYAPGTSQRERNLELKAKLKENESKGKTKTGK